MNEHFARVERAERLGDIMSRALAFRIRSQASLGEIATLGLTGVFLVLMHQYFHSWYGDIAAWGGGLLALMGSTRNFVDIWTSRIEPK